YREVTVPEPGPYEIVVRTHYSWISNGTEGSLLRGERVNGETPYKPGDRWPFPIVAGYQSTGIVESVGDSVQLVQPGEWVFCPMGRIDGMYEAWGGHISLKVAHETQVWKIPEDVSPIAASGLVLTQVGYNCGIRAPINISDVALVIGDGMVGHWAAQTLHWRGAKVILAGKHDDRLSFFPEGNNRYRVNVTRQDILEVVRAIAPCGIQVLVHSSGPLSSVMECHPLMKHDGHIVSAGFIKEDSLIDVQRLRFGELALHCPSGWSRQRMDETLSLIASGYLDTESLITHRFPVKDAAEAWNVIIARTETVLGVILEWV
ncbi:MAG TPA: hypothetical protein PKH07_06980, partial [bacterium]|nr:hypothetical protein [bacterium]